MLPAMRRLLTSSDRSIHLGLLVLRLGIGAAFIAHGLPKLMAGPEGWPKWGEALGNFGIDFGHQAFGLMAGLAETGGGLLLMLGLLTRFACVAMMFTMLVAASTGFDRGFKGYSHALEAGLMFLAVFVAGPGRHSLDHKLFR